MNAKRTGHFAAINGLKLYYEIFSPGEAGGSCVEPLILLHGGIGSVDAFAGLLPALAHTRVVVGVDLQAHGGYRSAAAFRADGG